VLSRRRRRGVTLLELVIAIGLAVPITVAALGTFSSTRRTWTRGVARATTAVDLRRGLNEATRLLASAQGLRACADPGREPPVVVTLADCDRTGPRTDPVVADGTSFAPSPVALAEDDEVCVWAPPVTDGGGEPAAPELVCLEIEDELELTRVPMGSLSLASVPGQAETSELFPGPTASHTTYDLDDDRSGVRYFGADGAEMPFGGDGRVDPAEVALIELTATPEYGPSAVIVVRPGGDR